MREIEIVTQKSTYVAGEKVLGYILVRCDEYFEFNRIHVTFTGKEHTRIERGSGDDRRVYTAKKLHANQRAPMREAGSLSVGTHRMDFAFDAPDFAPSSYKGRSGWIDYEISAQVEISWALDLKAHTKIYVIRPIGNYEFIGLWDTYEKDGLEIARMELLEGGLCIGGELKFKFKICSDANIRGIRAELVQREIAKAQGYTDDTKRVFVTDYFEEDKIPRDQWLVGRLKTDKTVPPSFKSELVTSELFVKLVLDIPWAFDKSVKVPLISGYCVTPSRPDD